MRILATAFLIGSITATPSFADSLVWHCATQMPLTHTSEILEFRISGTKLMEMTGDRLLKRFLAPSAGTQFLGESYSIVENDDAALVAEDHSVSSTGISLHEIIITKSTENFLDLMITQGAGSPPVETVATNGACTPT